ARDVYESIVVVDCDRVAVGEDAEARVRDGAMEAPQLGVYAGEDSRVFYGHEPVVDAFGERVVGDGVVHEPPRDVDLAHGAAGPGDHFGREHGAHSQLLADGEEQRVHARRIRGGELGDVPDPHEERGAGVAPVRLRVPL